MPQLGKCVGNKAGKATSLKKHLWWLQSRDTGLLKDYNLIIGL